MGADIYLQCFGKLVFRKDAMGFGDVKLMAMIGGIVGWKLAVAVFLLRHFSTFNGCACVNI